MAARFGVWGFLLTASVVYIVYRLWKGDDDSGGTSPPGGAPAPSGPRNRQNERDGRGPCPSREANPSASSSSTREAKRLRPCATQTSTNVSKEYSPNIGPRNRIYQSNGSNGPIAYNGDGKTSTASLLDSPNNDSIPIKPLVPEPYSRVSRLSVKKGVEALPRASAGPSRSSLKRKVDQGPAKPRSSRPAPSRPYIQLPTPSGSEASEISPTSPEALIKWDPISPPVSKVERPPSPSPSHPFTDRSLEDELPAHPPMQPESFTPSRSVSESSIGVSMSEDDSWSHASSSVDFSDESWSEVRVWRPRTT